MDNIILIGFMGSGKTTVGKLLSERLGRELIDTDDLIEDKMKMKIEEIFNVYGEEYFRNIESEICSNLKDYKGKIISCGGGIIIRDENMINLKKAGKVFLLKVSRDKVLERTRNEIHRPLLNGEEVEKKIDKLLKDRREKYERAADVAIDTDSLTPEEVVDKIIKVVSDKS